MKRIMRWFAESFTPVHIILGIILFGLAAWFIHVVRFLLT